MFEMMNIGRHSMKQQKKCQINKSYDGMSCADLRFGLVTEAMFENSDFEGYSNMQKMCFLLSDSRIVRSSTRFCTLILEQR